MHTVIVRLLASALRRLRERQALELQLVRAGAVPAQWWESATRLRMRLWYVATFGVEPRR